MLPGGSWPALMAAASVARSAASRAGSAGSEVAVFVVNSRHAARAPLTRPRAIDGSLSLLSAMPSMIPRETPRASSSRAVTGIVRSSSVQQQRQCRRR